APPPPPRPAPRPPSPTPSPSPSPTPSARPTPSPIALPTFHKAVRKQPRGGPSPVTLMLLITAPAALAVAVLRPRSSR
ncbi:hypothetical protein GT042_20155, partial [Streptomyces sp. SID3212]|nr:hypothetical protein [Streptomyces sp. SID3212]